MQYKVIFFDDTETISSSFNSIWNSLPKKPIKKLEYYINNRTIVLEGYEAYNHIKEDIMIINKGYRFIIRLLVKNVNNVLEVVINPFNIKKPLISYNTYEFTKEFRGQAYSNWKMGISSLSPRCYIL